MDSIENVRTKIDEVLSLMSLMGEALERDSCRSDSEKNGMWHLQNTVGHGLSEAFETLADEILEQRNNGKVKQ